MELGDEFGGVVLGFSGQKKLGNVLRALAHERRAVSRFRRSWEICLQISGRFASSRVGAWRQKVRALVPNGPRPNPRPPGCPSIVCQGLLPRFGMATKTPFLLARSFVRPLHGMFANVLRHPGFTVKVVR